MKLDTGFGEISLADKMPELHFFEGTAGYLATHAMQAHNATPPAPMLAAAEQALGQYVDRTRGAAPAIAATVAQELRASLIGDSEKEVAALSAAVSADPADAHAKNLLAIAKLRRWMVTSKSTSQPEIAEHFVAAAVLDPDHRDPLINLRSFYQLVLSGKGPAVANADRLPAKEATARLAMVEKMLEAGTTSPDR